MIKVGDKIKLLVDEANGVTEKAGTVLEVIEFNYDYFYTNTTDSNKYDRWIFYQTQLGIQFELISSLIDYGIVGGSGTGLSGVGSAGEGKYSWVSNETGPLIKAGLLPENGGYPNKIPGDAACDGKMVWPEEYFQKKREDYLNLHGLSRRDHIASMAMQGLIDATDPWNNINAPLIVGRSIEIADALMDALDKKGK